METGLIKQVFLTRRSLFCVWSPPTTHHTPPPLMGSRGSGGWLSQAFVLNNDLLSGGERTLLVGFPICSKYLDREFNLMFCGIWFCQGFEMKNSSKQCLMLTMFNVNTLYREYWEDFCTMWKSSQTRKTLWKQPENTLKTIAALRESRTRPMLMVAAVAN